MKRLSVVIITRNEAAIIARSLESVKWADEIVVVDSCSGDGTTDICRRYTDKVYVQPWLGFAAQRNFGIDKATGEWILSLDADEIVPPELRQKIEGICEHNGDGYDGFYIPRRHYFIGDWLRFAGQFPGYTLLLFRREHGRFRNCKVHETVVVDGRVGYLREATNHYSTPSFSSRFARVERCSILSAEELLDKHPDFRVTQFHLLLRPLRHFVFLFFQKRGYRDGTRGLLWAALQAFEMFCMYAQVWERTSGQGETGLHE